MLGSEILIPLKKNQSETISNISMAPEVTFAILFKYTLSKVGAEVKALIAENKRIVKCVIVKPIFPWSRLPAVVFTPVLEKFRHISRWWKTKPALDAISKIPRIRRHHDDQIHAETDPQQQTDSEYLL